MSWFVIDHQGAREIPDARLDELRGAGASPGALLEAAHKAALEVSAWPAFARLAVRAPLEQVRDALEALALAQGLRCLETRAASAPLGCPLECPGVALAERQGWTLVAEPCVEPELRFVNADLVDALFEALGVDGLFFGFEELTSAVHFARFEQGQLRLLWYDAQVPGPSFALTFHQDGRCTEEDARRYAARHMGLSEQALELDRFAFLTRLTDQAGLPDWGPRELGAPASVKLTMLPDHEAHQIHER